MKANKGFTLIELVVVIVILGILAVSAVPRFIDLSTQAEDAAVQGVAGALSSASAINYAAASAGSADAVVIDDSSTCTTAANSLLQEGSLPTGYTTSTTAFTGAVPGDVQTCAIAGSGTSTADATVIVTD